MDLQTRIAKTRGSKQPNYPPRLSLKLQSFLAPPKAFQSHLLQPTAAPCWASSFDLTHERCKKPPPGLLTLEVGSIEPCVKSLKSSMWVTVSMHLLCHTERNFWGLKGNKTPTESAFGKGKLLSSGIGSFDEWPLYPQHFATSVLQKGMTVFREVPLEE